MKLLLQTRFIIFFAALFNNSGKNVTLDTLVIYIKVSRQHRIEF